MSKQGEFLKNARRRLGLTQKQLADKLNVSDKVISKWEVGDSFPDYTLLPQLANILQVEIQEILNGEYQEKTNVIAETKEVIYVEKKSTGNPTTFKDKIISALKFMCHYRNIFFASFLGLSLILMFCRFFSWEVPSLGFKNSFFKLLFAPFQKDINKYLYGDFVSAMNSQFTTNTNILVYIISALIWFYIIFIGINIFKLIKSAVKKEDIERKIIFKRTLIYSILTIVLFILSFILKSQFIKMFNSSGLTFDNYESMGVGAKTCSVLPMIWSFIVIAFSSVFNFVKVFSEENVKVTRTVNTNSYTTNNQNVVSAPRIPKEKVELTPEQKARRKKIIIITIIIAAICSVLSAGIGGIIIYNNNKPSPQNTVKAYLDNINTNKYENNIGLIYGMNENDKQLYENLSLTYKLYNNLSLTSLNTIYVDNEFSLYNATITCSYVVSGNSTLNTYKVDIPIYKNNGKYLLLEPLDFIYGSSCQCDKENKCVSKNGELILYYGNDIDSFVIPNNVSSIKDTFYDNINGNGRYRILYNVNSSNPTSYTVNSGRITLTEPVKNGYTFAGWIGTGISTPQNTVIIDSGSTGNRYYIALWNLVHYEIKYNDVSVNNNPTSYTIEDEINLNYPEKQGFTFAGWIGSNGNKIQGNVSILKGSYGNKEYTAIYNETPYNLTYNLQGGLLNNPNPTNYYVNSESFTLNNPIKEGYTFSGWTLNSETTKQLTVQIEKYSYGDKNYTANWTLKNYNITYNLNDGINDSRNPSHYNIETPSFSLYDPTSNEYAFIGWTGSNGNTPSKNIIVNNGSIGDLHFTANWAYLINYELDGGTNNSNNKSYYLSTTETFNIYEPTKSGYTFLGWTGSNGATPQKEIKINKGSKGHKTFIANWEINNYTITYNLLGGTNDSSNPSSYNVVSGNITLRDATKNNYVFGGWYLNSDYSSDRLYSINMQDPKDLVLYAKWYIGISSQSDIESILSNSLYWNENFLLLNDINLGGSDFTPIGNSAITFTGEFNGNGHTISNFVIKPNTSYIGFLGYTNNAKVQNLSISGATVSCSTSSTVYAGIISGYSKNCTYYNCSVTNCSIQISCSGTSGQQKQIIGGGLIGDSYNDYLDKMVSTNNNLRLTSNSYSYGQVFCYQGGIVGNAENITLVNSNATVNISNTITGAFSAGGLTGIVRNGTIKNCYTTGNMRIETTGGTDTFGLGMGGLCGGNSEVNIYNSYSSVNIEMKGGVYPNAGGLCGSHTKGIIQHSYATGNVSVSTSIGYYGGPVAGGLVGDCSCDINNCYSTGNVTLTCDCKSGNTTTMCGGLIGYYSYRSYQSKEINNCYSKSNVYATITATESGSGTCAIGGLIGDRYNGSVRNCYSEGYLNCKLSCTKSNASNRINIGGLIGESYYGDKIINCFSNTRISSALTSNSENSYTTCNVGYIVGYLDDENSLENSYYNKNISIVATKKITEFSNSINCEVNKNGIESTMDIIWTYVYNNWDSEIWDLFTNQNPTLKQNN